ncbi:hypothetical protein HJ039_08780 [Vibrio parahaemolyticus]|nr:hypothetical protein [Vibrio parahaemolyticus]
MEIVNKSLTIDVDLDDDVWGEIVKVTKTHDDISLIVKGVGINMSKLVIPESISSIEFKYCSFNEEIEICGLEKGRYFGIKNCKKNFIFGNVTLKEICCRVFSFIEETPENIDEEELFSNLNLSPFIKNCAFHHFNCHSISCPEFTNVVFIDKFTYRCILANENISLFFGNCRFISGLKIEVLDVDNLEIIIKKSQVTDKDNHEDLFQSLSGLVSFNVSKNTVIKNIEVFDSKLKGMNFYFFKKRIENVDIKKSVLGILEFYTASDDENNYIYNINIIESEVDKLSLRYKNIVHEMSLLNTTFNAPPELLGANIPSGSIFPKKEYFKSRSGVHDASCYRNIRFAMESQRDRDLEGMFFGLEQESIMNIKDGVSKYFSLSYLYLVLSNYGTNYTRPLIILSLSIIFFSLTNSILLSPIVSPSLPIDWELVFRSFILTIKQVLQPFSTLKDISFNIEESGTVNYLYVIFGVINSLISIGCIALSALAIRWKFKRG